jgi:hypothetical protein
LNSYERLAHEFDVVARMVDKPESKKAENVTQAELDADAEAYRAEIKGRNQRKAKYAALGLWVEYILSVPEWNRIEAFAEVGHLLSDRTYWRMLGRVFAHTNPSVSHLALWNALFLSVRSGREFFAESESDRVFWNSLPEEIIAYRGQGKSKPQGRFFSLHRETAELYARQHHGDDGVVQTRVFNKVDCLYYGGRYYQLTYVFNMGNIAALTAATSSEVPRSIRATSNGLIPCCWDALTCTHGPHGAQ